MGWVSLILEVVPIVYGAVSNYNTSKAQSEMDADSALANSIAIKNAGAYNAKALQTIAAINSSIGIAGAQIENASNRAITEMNIDNKLFLSNYEASLLENEAMLIGEAAELDLKQLERKHVQAIGEMRTTQAASGAIIDQDTPALAVEDAKEQQELERFIVRRGADIQMAKLMDRAAFGRWEAALEANSMATSGRLLETTNIAGAFLKGFGISTQAGLDAGSVLYNSGVSSGQAYTTGMQKSDASANQASTSFWNGVFGAGSSVAKNYVNTKKENDVGNSSLLMEGNSVDPYATSEY